MLFFLEVDAVPCDGRIIVNRYLVLTGAHIIKNKKLLFLS